MFYRVRTRLADSPGALARLAQHCGDAGANILALQIYPELGAVVDDLVVETPDGWTAAAVAELVGGAGGDEVSVVPCATHDLIDQPTAWLRAAMAVHDDPDLLPSALSGLLGPSASWSATEQVRAEVLTTIAERGRVEGARPWESSPAPEPASVVEYDVGEAHVTARIGRHVVGAARLGALADDAVEGDLEVAPAWRRVGIGRQLLRRLSGLAAGVGASELVLVAPPSEEGVARLLAASGMRGRIRLTEDGLTVRVHLTGVRPIGAAAAR